MKKSQENLKNSKEAKEHEELKLIDNRDQDDILQRIGKIKYEIEDCYMYMKFLDLEIKDMQEQMVNIEKNDVKLLKKQNEQYKQAFIRDNVNNKFQYYLLNYYEQYYYKRYYIEGPRIRKISTYGVQVRYLKKDPYEPFVNPRDTARDIQSKVMVFSVTQDLEFCTLYQKVCAYWKLDPDKHVLTDIDHNNLQILFSIQVANFFYYETQMEQCILFISKANRKINELLDSQKQSLLMNKERNLEQENQLANDKQKKNMLPLIEFLQEYKPGVLNYKVNSEQIHQKPRLTAKLYRFIINFILLFLCVDMSVYYANYVSLQKMQKGVFYRQQNETYFKSIDDVLKYHAVVTTRYEGNKQVIDYSQLQTKDSLVFTAYDNKCNGVIPTDLLENSDWIQIGPKRIVFKLTIVNPNCLKRVQSTTTSSTTAITCYYAEYIAPFKYTQDICDAQQSNCYKYQTAVQTQQQDVPGQLQVLDGSGYVLDIPADNYCHTMLSTVNQIINQGVLNGMHTRAVVVTQNYYDYVNQAFIVTRSIYEQQVDGSLLISFKNNGFIIYYGSNSDQTHIAAPILKKKLRIQDIIQLNNICNVVCIYLQLTIVQTMFDKPGTGDLTSLLNSTTFVDLDTNYNNFANSLVCNGALIFLLFFKTIIQMNFLTYYSEMINILRLSAGGILSNLVLLFGFIFMNAFIFQYIFGCHFDQTNNLNRAANYYFYLIFYTTSRDYTDIQLDHIDMNFTVILYYLGLFLVYNNFICLQVAIMMNSSVIMSLNKTFDESVHFSAICTAIKQSFKLFMEKQQKKFIRFKNNLLKKKKKKI